MSTLTTRQRDLLKLLLNASEPQGAGQLAAQVQLTPRQVSYDLKSVRRWLSQHDINLVSTPGVGVYLDCTPLQCRHLATELATSTDLQLILSSSERQQLAALLLLTAGEPLILFQLQQLLQVSRTTALRDIDTIEQWLNKLGLVMQRRPNYGIAIEGAELQRRQAIARILWGQTPFADALTEISHARGLQFPLASQAHLMPAVAQVHEIIRGLPIDRMASHVAYVEAQLGGRFSDDAVLHLGIVLAIQTIRVQSGHFAVVSSTHIDWLRTLSIWPVAVKVARRLSWKAHQDWPESEVALLAMHFLSAPRNGRWPGDLEVEPSYRDFIDKLMQRIARAYGRTTIEHDSTLRDGLVIHLVPTCLQQRFQLWIPLPAADLKLSAKYEFECRLAQELAETVAVHSQIRLPESEVNNIAFLLRAAYIREQPRSVHRVLVVCASGMATAQLLLARLKAHFPRLDSLEVISIRELGQTALSSSQLVITTVPLPKAVQDAIPVIRVHPLLLPEDIQAITDWLD